MKRSDLRADLKKQGKQAGDLALSSQCYHVWAEGTGAADDVPLGCGVIVASEVSLQMVRAAPKKPMRFSFGVWMALAKADRFKSLADPTPSL